MIQLPKLNKEDESNKNNFKIRNKSINSKHLIKDKEIKYSQIVPQKKLKFNFEIIKDFKFKKKKKFNDLFNMIENINYKSNKQSYNFSLTKKKENEKVNKSITFIKKNNINHPGNQLNFDKKVLNFQLNIFYNKEKNFDFKKLKKGNLIGKGGFGEIYKIINLQDNRIYAGKFSQENNFLKNNLILENEFNILKNLNHKNIIKFYDSIIFQNKLVYLMDYYSNGSLLDIIKKSQILKIELIKKLGKEILEGIAYIHDKNIIHRDLKSANILINKQGDPIIADFGSSSYKNDKSQFSNNLIFTKKNIDNKSIKGSIYWMPPEVILENFYDTKSDIWSFGCILLEMITGKHPWYLINNFNDFLFEIKNHNKPCVPCNIDKNILEILNQCFNYNITNRPSAKELLNDKFFKNTKIINFFFK